MKVTAPIQAVIFDKDGTLFDTERVLMRAWQLSAKEFNIPNIEPVVRECTGKTIPDIAIYWKGKYPQICFEDFLARRQFHLYRIIDEEGLPLKTGTREILAYLKENHIKIGLATSAELYEAEGHLKMNGLYDDFDAIVTADMVTHGKPHPEPYLLAASKLGIDPAYCVGVEDSLNGVRSIHAAGMRAVMIPDMIPPTEEIKGLLWQECDSLLSFMSVLQKA